MINYSFLSLIKEYEPITLEDIKNSMKEVIQRIILCGLAKDDFFRNAVFYGGTSLRIFRGLPRFSEDLDFLMTNCSTEFDFKKYLLQAKETLSSFGLECELSSKQKKQETSVESYFFNFNLKMLVEITYPKFTRKIISNEILSVKVEIGKNGIFEGNFENLLLFKPNLCFVKTFDMETLFASKLIAILNRKWDSRLKGRDFYDYLFYLSKDTKVNLSFLNNGLRKFGYLDSNEQFSLDTLKKVLIDKFNEVNFDECKKDVLRFIKNNDSIISGFNKETFMVSVNMIKEK
ncbi:MAG: nucleotidyl transferase AbiEii/AbiGii toxin family protein [Bacilli bacterium]|nr:nucleotidyl transferase AbiEii/AbiGii toxin family protein [Bacilli bacterium]